LLKTPLATRLVLLRLVIRLCHPATGFNTCRRKQFPTIVWRHLHTRCMALYHVGFHVLATHCCATCFHGTIAQGRCKNVPSSLSSSTALSKSVTVCYFGHRTKIWFNCISFYQHSLLYGHTIYYIYTSTCFGPSAIIRYCTFTIGFIAPSYIGHCFHLIYFILWVWRHVIA
jgi:hypothetical protein